MSYSVKEIFFTLQGEGRNSGRAAVFCRFAGCNLWNGRDADRHRAHCTFCDTDFVGLDGPGGGRFADAPTLVDAIAHAWMPETGTPLAVFTGGEPALQLDEQLVEAAKTAGMMCAIETNGTLALPEGLDWVCVSPKAGCPLAVRSGDELKLIFPQPGLDPQSLVDLDFTDFVLQPMDGPHLSANTAAAVDYCLAHPPWRLGLQTHKLVGLP